MNVTNIRGILRNEGEVSLLSRCPVFTSVQGFVVSIDVKRSSLEEVGKVLDGGM